MSDKKYFYQKEKVEAELKLFYEERDKEREAVKKREAYYEDIERRARKIATEIISQNSIYANERETSEGLQKGHKSVFGLSTVELLKEAEKSRGVYNAKRNELMKELMRKNSELKLSINNLKEQANLNSNRHKSDKEEIMLLRNKISEMVKNPTKGTYMIDTEQGKKAKQVIKEKVKEVNNNIQKRHLENILDDIESNEIKESNMPDKDKIDALTEKLQKCDASTWERAKNIFVTIGKTGFSLKPDIEKAHKERLEEQAKKKNINNIENLLKNLNDGFDKLENLGVVDKGTFTYWKSTVTYYLLTGIGVKVYKNLLGEAPKTAEITEVVSCHHNPQHGYGIIKLAELMREYPNRFSEISEYNKGEKGKTLNVKVRLEDGSLEAKTIEPDIVFRETFEGVNEERYIEYELGTQKPDEYYNKINKYVNRGVDNIFFLFPNDMTRNNFKRHIKNFIAKKKEKGIEYPDLKFYLYTTKEFIDMCANKEDWVPYNSENDSRYSKTPEELKAEEKKKTDGEITGNRTRIRR